MDEKVQVIIEGESIYGTTICRKCQTRPNSTMRGSSQGHIAVQYRHRHVIKLLVAGSHTAQCQGVTIKLLNDNEFYLSEGFGTPSSG